MDSRVNFNLLSSSHHVLIKPYDELSVLVKKKEFEKTLRRLALNNENKIYNFLKFVESNLLEKFNIKKSKYKLSHEQREENKNFALISLYILNYRLNFSNYPGFLILLHITNKQKEEILPYINRWYVELELALIIKNILSTEFNNIKQSLTQGFYKELALCLYQRSFNQEYSEEKINSVIDLIYKNLTNHQDYSSGIKTYNEKIVLDIEVKSNIKTEYKNFHFKNKPNYLFEYQKRRKIHEN